MSQFLKISQVFHYHPIPRAIVFFLMVMGFIFHLPGQSGISSWNYPNIAADFSIEFKRETNHNGIYEIIPRDFDKDGDLDFMIHIGFHFHTFENLSKTGQWREAWHAETGIAFPISFDWYGFCEAKVNMIQRRDEIICGYQKGLVLRRLKQVTDFAFSCDPQTDEIRLYELYGENESKKSAAYIGQLVDMNHDGWSDLVLFIKNVNDNSNQLRIWFADGKNSLFDKHYDVLLAEYPSDFIAQNSCAGDFNSDGRMDAALHCQDEEENCFIKILYQPETLDSTNKQAQWVNIIDRQGQLIETSIRSYYKTQDCMLISGDFDNDSLIDIIADGMEDNRRKLFYLRNTGLMDPATHDLIFELITTIDRGNGNDFKKLVQAFSADFNQDDRLDIIAVDRKKEIGSVIPLRIEVFMNNSEFIPDKNTNDPFQRYLLYPENDFYLPRSDDSMDLIYSIAAFDYNGDGYCDIIGGHHAAGGPFDVLFFYKQLKNIPHLDY